MSPATIAAWVFAVAVLVLWLWMGVRARRDHRVLAVKERAELARFEANRPATDAAMARSASRIPSRGHILRASVRRECLVESEVAEDAVLLIAAATGLCRTSAEQFANARLLDEYATKYPMKQRPRLVEPAESEINPLTGGDLS